MIEDMKISFLIPISLLASFQQLPKAIAADQACSAKSVTRNCEFFREHESEAEITLPDGTSYKNPLYNGTQAGSNTYGNGPYGSGGYGQGGGAYGSGGYGMGSPGSGGVYGSTMSVEDMQKLQEQFLADQSKVLEILDGSSLPMRSRLFLSTSGIFLVGQNMYPVSAPLPLASKDGKFKQVSQAEVIEDLKKSLSPEKYNQLFTMWSQKSSQMFAAMENQRQEYAKAMAKLQEEANQKNLKNKNREKRVRELFEFSKEQVISAIKNGVDTSKLSPVKKKMIEKIEKIQMTDMNDPKLASQPMCLSGNAFYSPESNTMNLCPIWMYKPDADLVAILAHEIGHSVDPCHFQMESYDIDRWKFEEFMASGNMNTFDAQSIRSLISAESTTLNYSLDFFVSDPELPSRLIKSGALKVRQDFTAFKDYPFAKEFACQTGGNGFKPLTAKDHTVTLNYMKGMLASAKQPELVKRSLAQFKKVSERYPQCLGSVTHDSQMGEVMADSFGAYALEAYVRDNPLKTEAERIGALPESHRQCQADSTKETSIGKYVPPLALLAMIPRSRDAHPQDQQRLEKIKLSRPALASLYGCKPSGKNCFMGLPAKTQGAGGKATQEEGIQ